MKKLMMSLVILLVAGVVHADSWHTYTEADHDCHVWVESWDNGYGSATDQTSVTVMGGGITLGVQQDALYHVSEQYCDTLTFMVGYRISAFDENIDGQTLLKFVEVDPSEVGNNDSCFDTNEAIPVNTTQSFTSGNQVIGVDVLQFEQYDVEGTFEVDEVRVYDNAESWHCGS